MNENEVKSLIDNILTDFEVKPRHKKKMKTVKKIMLYLFVWLTIVQIYTMVMTFVLRSDTALTIVAASVFTEAVAVVIWYFKYKTTINSIAMEQNYDPNYDHNNNIY